MAVRYLLQTADIITARTKRMASYLPPLNYITLHYAYFIIVCLISSLIFWGSSNPSKSIGYTDSLFLVVSAMTEAGLNTVNLSQMTTFQQFILWFLILIGSAIWVSIFTVHTRKRVFETRFKHIIKAQREARRLRRRERSASWSRSQSRGLGTPRKNGNESREAVDDEHLARGEKNPEERHDEETRDNVVGPPPGAAIDETAVIDGDDITPQVNQGSRILSFPEGLRDKLNSTSYQLAGTKGVSKRSNPKNEDDDKTLEGEDEQSGVGQHYRSFITRYNTGRNAQFFDLTHKEREHLGGVEYRAISLLGWIVPIYFILWQLIASCGLGAYMAYNKPSVAEGNGFNPWWLGAFNAVSAFNNSGMSLLDLNMIPFQKSSYALITMGLLILAGNTAYPLFLRLILWTMLKLLCLIYPNPSRYSHHKETLRFVLQYPRRVYTNLFPSAPTWWLLFVLIILNGTDWAAFELLNIGNEAVQQIPAHSRVLDGLFQALAVRSGGFYVISIPTLRIGLQVLYVIMMYISVYPVVITMRNSNVYEERSLGIYADDPILSSSPSLSSSMNPGGEPHTTTNQRHAKAFRFFKRTLTGVVKTSGPGGSSPSSTEFVRQQIRGQLSHDLWIIITAILFISCIEVANFERDPINNSVFNIAFEVVSGYGCVGISIGLPNESYSFSGGWHKASKLILCVVMLRGRHRGLPVALDRAVRLPSEHEVGEEEIGERGVATGKEDRVRRLSLAAAV